jgi:hypothetical protein
MSEIEGVVITQDQWALVEGSSGSSSLTFFIIWVGETDGLDEYFERCERLTTLKGLIPHLSIQFVKEPEFGFIVTTPLDHSLKDPKLASSAIARIVWEIERIKG